MPRTASAFADGALNEMRLTRLERGAHIRLDSLAATGVEAEVAEPALSEGSMSVSKSSSLSLPRRACSTASREERGGVGRRMAFEDPHPEQQPASTCGVPSR
eukprot:scaffold120901_cov30-Tisochrysis_lutea.AAC.3